jgi:subtilisin-like proprotein convertase family protein
LRQYSTDVPKAISSSGTPTITSQLVISLNGVIDDVNVIDLEGTHTYLDDLRFILTSPAGTEVILIDRWCGSQNNFDINLDDQAAPGPAPCPYNNGQTYQPEEDLSEFNGENSIGTWTLTVQDLANQDGGSLESWALEICISSGCTIVTSNSDSGSGSLREALSCVEPGGIITFAPAVYNTSITLMSPIIIIKNVSILSIPDENITVDASATTRAFTVRDPAEVAIAGITVNGGTEAAGCAIQNFGKLTINDITLHPGLLPNASLLANLGLLTLIGNCQISQ